MNATEALRLLNAPQRACLLAALAEDPDGDWSLPPRGRRPGRRRPLFLAGHRRSRGPLLELDLLGWAPGWDDANTLLPLGREAARLALALHTLGRFLRTLET